MKQQSIYSIPQGIIEYRESNSLIYVDSLFVYEKFRRQGFGSKLLDDLQNEKRKDLTLECWETLLVFYLKQGFKILEMEEDGYYVLRRRYKS